MSRQLGDLGEAVAQAYLRDRGYRILDCNFFSRYGELDIVAMSPESVLVFFEVKSYQSQSMVDPLFSVTAAKQKRLRKTAEYYVYHRRIVDQDMRFDVICVDGDAVDTHLENAF